ncbi:uncharacterized protein LY89DRAFT_710606 [Mollisia scopiformis]|uniref:tRNA (adenine(58)-N(1))-methyltransferase catalytic subunit TRM61 n=1 Tax=Mollisia scopiformis TaxID=149040 RepID=A0A194WTP6_MOLSC|nr:uncharacterized protein LY89DRAFT_710606 [Mollisia scopiformis]KUJ10982.1 hypothetical protein LY89DRAFT_710606 [Mollisia scopiformis]
MNFYAQSAQKAGRRFINGPKYSCSSCTRRLYSSGAVKENDIVLLKHRSSSSAPIITNPLKPGGKVNLVLDSINHEDIIGKAKREVVVSRKRVLYRIHEPTLAEYTDNSPRLVTPIYSQDANLIVSLLDINPVPPGSQSAGEDKLEIFEAGTGHGALTLHLARAIHAANAPLPMLPEAALESESLDMGFKRVKLDTQEDTQSQEQKEVKLAYEEWRSKRRAVIHTLDTSEKHSAHAEMVVRNFRKGLYFPHIDFHVGKIEDYLSPRLIENGQQPFLDHAILDLPGTHDYLDIVGKALKPDGSLLVFCPSITQIIDCIKHVKERRLPFFLEQTVEVGGAVGVGGREWDVRRVKPRALLKAEGEESPESVPESGDDEGWQIVCRPKVGVRISGGGFVGHFRKIVEFPARNVK